MAEQTLAHVAQATLAGQELARSTPSREQFDATSLQVRGPQWFEFEAAFVQSLSGKHREQWLDVILGRMELQAGNVDRFVPRREDAVQAMKSESQHWAERRLIEPWAIWTERSVQINLGDYASSRMLSQVDFARWMMTIDSMQSPSWMKEQAFASDIQEDRALLFRLVDEAPLVFDDWKPTGSVLALIAAEWILGHAVRIDGALAQAASNRPENLDEVPAEVRAFRDEELSQFFETAFCKLLDRSDGTVIALHFSANLASRLIHSEVRRNSVCRVGQQFDIPLAALNALSKAIRSRGARIKQYKRLDGVRDKAARDWLSKKPTSRSVAVAQQPVVARANDYGEGGRNRASEALPVWVAAMGYVYAAEPPEPGELATLWGLLESVLRARDSGLRCLVNDEVENTRTVAWMAQVLMRLDSPTDTWCESYARLEPQRRRAQYSLQYEDHDEGYPSMILLQVASCAVSMLSEDRQKERAALFDVAENAARRLWLTPGRELGCDWKHLYAQIISLIWVVFGSGAAEHLAATWRKVASNGWLLCASAKLLLDRGMSVRLLDDSARRVGIDLEVELSALKNWTQPTNTKGYPPGFDALLEALVSWRNGSAMASGTEDCTLPSLAGDQKVECADA